MQTRLRKFEKLMICLALLVTGCEQSSKTIHTFETSLQSASGNSTGLLLIASAKSTLSKKEDEVGAQLYAAVNGGKYNITAIKTQYSSGYLTSAEVIYDTSRQGDGNHMRILLIQNDAYSWDRKAADIQHHLNRIVSSGSYNIIKINTIKVEGYLLAAEVYYRSK